MIYELCLLPGNLFFVREQILFGLITSNTSRRAESLPFSWTDRKLMQELGFRTLGSSSLKDTLLFLTVSHVLNLADPSQDCVLEPPAVL